MDGTRFLIGSRVPYEGRKGLMNTTGTAEQKYDRAAFRPAHGFWADFIHPTSVVEGGLYHTLNTYDSARFTFTFLQYAAHVPDGDFVRFMRALLMLPLAKEYFPDLKLSGGRICRVGENDLEPLETSGSTEGLMDYFNPSSAEVEDTEVIQSARLVHWAQSDPEHRRVQIEVGIAHIRENLARYSSQYGLDGKADTVCLLVVDIRHQGRAKSAAIIGALASADPVEALLQLGEPKYHARVLGLRREIKRLTDDGTLGNRKYSAAARDFVAK
ncbi:MAG: hypothetical protein ABI919_07630 [Ramlibacter sp.]